MGIEPLDRRKRNRNGDGAAQDRIGVRVEVVGMMGGVVVLCLVCAAEAAPSCEHIVADAIPSFAPGHTGHTAASTSISGTLAPSKQARRIHAGCVGVR